MDLNVWANHFSKQTNSGMTVSKYCKKEKISPGSWYKYKRILEEASSKDFADLKVAKSSTESLTSFEIAESGGLFTISIKSLDKPSLHKLVLSLV